MTIIEASKMEPYVIMEDYYPKDETKISSAITLIKKKLLKGKSLIDVDSEAIETSYRVSALAINYLGELSQTIQKSFYEIKEQLYSQLLDQEYQQYLSTNEEMKDVQRRLYQIFCVELDHTEETQAKTPTEYLQKEDESHTKIVSAFTNKHTQSPLSSEDIDGKKKQIKFVKDFGRRFMRDYYPAIVMGKSSSPTDQYLQHALKEFMQAFPPAIPHFLFHDPKIVEQHEKNIIISVLEQVTIFFHIYNQSIEVIKRGDKQFDDRDLVDKEAIILSKMRSVSNEIKQASGPTQESMIPGSLNEAEMMINLTNIVKNVILQYYKNCDPDFKDTPKTMQQFYAAVLPVTITPLLFDRILSPHLFRVLFINLLLRDIAIPDDCVESPAFKECDASDIAFTKQVGEIAQVLTSEILKFGEAKGILKGVKLIASKDSLGELIQKGINRVMGTDTCFIPVTLLDHLLYHNGKPTLIEAFSQTTQGSANNVEQDVKKRIYEILIEKLPSFLAWATDNFTSVDSFCETLSKRIFELTQSKKLFILFSCYLLKGFNEGLSKPVIEEK